MPGEIDHLVGEPAPVERGDPDRGERLERLAVVVVETAPGQLRADDEVPCRATLHLDGGADLVSQGRVVAQARRGVPQGPLGLHDERLLDLLLVRPVGSMRGCLEQTDEAQLGQPRAAHRAHRDEDRPDRHEQQEQRPSGLVGEQPREVAERVDAHEARQSQRHRAPAQHRAQSHAVLERERAGRDQQVEREVHRAPDEDRQEGARLVVPRVDGGDDRHEQRSAEQGEPDVERATAPRLALGGHREGRRDRPDRERLDGLEGQHQEDQDAGLEAELDVSRLVREHEREPRHDHDQRDPDEVDEVEPSAVEEEVRHDRRHGDAQAQDEDPDVEAERHRGATDAR